MREIKFRAWDTKGYWLDADEFAVQGDGAVIIAFSSGPDGSRYRKTDAVVMQFTGLTDKNGREIFEGDLIENPDGEYIVKWDKGCFVAFRLAGGDDYLYHINNFSEVIGNIYEHPELMQEGGSE